MGGQPYFLGEKVFLRNTLIIIILVMLRIQECFTQQFVHLHCVSGSECCLLPVQLKKRRVIWDIIRRVFKLFKLSCFNHHDGQDGISSLSTTPPPLSSTAVLFKCN